MTEMILQQPPLPVSVLVVEDDGALRALFLALLRRHSFCVECVNDGAQALERLGERSYDVLLLDLMMPIVNGFDVLERLAETQPAMLRQTIVTTGLSERELAKLDRERIFAVLRKPFDIDCLISTIRQCVRQTPKPKPQPKPLSPPPPPPPASRTDDGRQLDGSVHKFEAAIPELRRLLNAATPSDRELMLRGELRRVVGRLGGILKAAASIETDAERARRFEEIGHAAARLSATHALVPLREH